MDKQVISRRFSGDPVFRGMLKELRDSGQIAVSGLTGGAKTALASFLDEREGNILIVCPEAETAARMCEDIKSLGGESVLFPPWEAERRPETFLPGDILSRQINALRALSGAKKTHSLCVVTSPKAFYHKLLSPARFMKGSLTLEEGKNYSPDRIIGLLVRGGYEEVSASEEKGQFARRGGIIDVYPFSADNPLRLEFFGDRIESIRYFDAFTQRSLGRLKECFIPPSSVFGEGSLFDFISLTGLVIVDEPGRVKEQMTASLWKKFLSFSAARKRAYFFSVFLPPGENFTAKNFTVESRGMDSLWTDFNSFAKRLEIWGEEKTDIWLLAGNEEEKKRLGELLQNHRVKPFFKLEVKRLNEGFYFPGMKMGVVNDHEIFRRYVPRKTAGSFRAGIPLGTYRELKKGDLVVHINHGIGRYRGIKKIAIKEKRKDFLWIEYREGSVLYVPLEEVKLVKKYIGFEGDSPRLCKLGGENWKKTVSKTKKALRDMAGDLLRIDALRESREGYAYPEESEWEKEFAASFVYEETPDQKEAIRAVKEDLEKKKPMDRLICGDVGYGKTEVAMRAAFKVVSHGKQAAILVPTTVLAQQHYYTFKDRLASFPVEVEMLCRFRNAEQQKKIVSALREGKIDIIIGTHRLLRDDVSFRDLGLLLIDEEQRFGVGHKEKIKKLREMVDVLTLSATPIPRTLYMSLVGIRDLSVIETPPRDRLPVETYVGEYDERIVTEAVRREVERKGQVFFVFNRINSIHRVAARLRGLFPMIEIAVAHGRLKERELEGIMRRFMDGDIQILVSTTIIESGLDIPNVNTIIITDSHRYGLADLYQLRGRVGRRSHRAFAYLFIPGKERVTAEALKRLKTMAEFTELGAGLRIAMRDLQIRGAGNILGPQQHGFVTAVGFDLYCRLLRESVREVKGEKPLPLQGEVDIKLDVPMFIPDSYIGQAGEKVEIYAKISSLETENELGDLKKELVDRYGPLEGQMEILLDLAELRIISSSLGIGRIQRRQGFICLYFHPRSVFSPDKIKSLVEGCREKVIFSQDKDERITLRIRADRNDRETLPILKKILRPPGGV